MSNASRGLIIGGGLAGLSAAIALKQVGIEVEVIEIEEHFGAVGAGMGVAGRAPEALEELGIYDQVAARSELGLGAPATYDLAGNLLQAPPPAPPQAEGLQPLGAYRPALAQILVARAEEVGVTLTTSTTVDVIDQRDDRIRVTLTDGTTREIDFLIGADGVRSRVRELVFPGAPEPQYVGQMSVRWLSDEGERVQPEGWYLAADGSKMAFYYQPFPQRTYAPFVINMPKTRLTQHDTYVLVRNFMEQFTAPAIVTLRERLHPDDELIPRPFEWLLLREWKRGRVLLIGDAAHATTAHMGMGGGMALEDGVVLAQEIDRAPGDIEDAFARFQTRRFDRVRTVVETSVELSRREQDNLPEDPSLMRNAVAIINQPY